MIGPTTSNINITVTGYPSGESPARAASKGGTLNKSGGDDQCVISFYGPSKEGESPELFDTLRNARLVEGGIADKKMKFVGESQMIEAINRRNPGDERLETSVTWTLTPTQSRS